MSLEVPREHESGDLIAPGGRTLQVRNVVVVLLQVIPDCQTARRRQRSPTIVHATASTYSRDIRLGPLAQLSLFAIESHRFSPFPDPPAVVSP